MRGDLLGMMWRLQPGALQPGHPFPRGISHAERDFSLARLSGGLATQSVTFPLPLAAGALAKHLKLMALRPWAFSVQVRTGASS